jgi:hypothetical protein
MRNSVIKDMISNPNRSLKRHEDKRAKIDYMKIHSYEDTIEVEGYWTDEPEITQTLVVCLGSWDGGADDHIAYYMDGAPLKVGMTICGNFVVTKV